MNEFENNNQNTADSLEGQPSAPVEEGAAQSALSEPQADIVPPINDPTKSEEPVFFSQTAPTEPVVQPDNEPEVTANSVNEEPYGQNTQPQYVNVPPVQNTPPAVPVNEQIPPVQSNPYVQPPMGQPPYNAPQGAYNQYPPVPPTMNVAPGQMPPYMQQGMPYTPYANIPKPFPENVGAANPVKYTPVEKNESSDGSRKGFKVFCVILAAVILLTGGCITGYFVGRQEPSAQSLYGDVDLDLAAKPKDTDESTAAEVYEQVDASIVGIRVYNTQGQIADASGVIYTEDGYVITNDHIYSSIGAPKFKIYTNDGAQYDADYVAGDVVSDLAVLKIREGKDLTPATLGDSNEIYCGERVAAIGRPNDATARSTITTGIVSLTSRRVQTTSSYSARLIQTDSAINPGSSGGALVNMYGQVIGITASKLSGENYDRIGFAIPTTTVKRVVEQLIKSGEVTDRAKLGISYSMVDSVTAEINNIDGVGLYVGEVTEDSDLYGKLGEGDIITHVNGIAITDDDIILDIIEECRAGDKISITVLTADGGQAEYTAVLKANIGESSYTEEIMTEESQNSSSGGGTFNFPDGE